MRTNPAAAGGPTWEAFTAAIIAAAGRTGAELTVIGRHGAGRLADALLGGTASRVLRESDRSVLLVPAGTPP